MMDSNSSELLKLKCRLYLELIDIDPDWITIDDVNLRYVLEHDAAVQLCLGKQKKTERIDGGRNSPVMCDCNLKAAGSYYQDGTDEFYGFKNYKPKQGDQA